MGSGPDTWQRRILAALSDRREFPLSYIVDDPTRSQYAALHRAVRALEGQGKIRVNREHRPITVQRPLSRRASADKQREYARRQYDKFKNWKSEQQAEIESSLEWVT